MTAGYLIRYISDGFFIASVISLGIGIFLWIYGKGGYNGLRYLRYSLVTVFSPANEKLSVRKSYYDFQNEQRQKREVDTKLLFLAGLIFLSISVVFSFLYTFLPI